MDAIEMRQLRSEVGWSQFKLEQVTHVSRNRIALHEQGYRSLEDWEISKIRLVLLEELQRKRQGESHNKHCLNNVSLNSVSGDHHES